MSTPVARPARHADGDADGQAVAAARKACGLTQQELSRQAMVSLSLLRKIEQGTRPLTPGVRTALAAVLGPVPPAGQDGSAPARITSALPLLREAMDAYDIPPDPPPGPLPLAELRRLTGSVTAWRLDSQYARLADLIPGLIASLTAAALGGIGHEQEQAFGLLPSPTAPPTPSPTSTATTTCRPARPSSSAGPLGAPATRCLSR
ncbi:MAG TPA: helix-turn-helix transcriptional regulator [Trebonia sp.]|nr:helix-turn-helix transcriptional regulator [Trebonia sp.]